MTNLVWDDSRIDELGALVHKTVVDFLEEFSVDLDAFRVAHLAEVAVKEALNVGLVDGTEEPEHDDSVKCCPDCERPNQFGELCGECERERQVGIAENRL